MRETFTHHLTAEILAAYVDDGLPQPERDKADCHLAQCHECLSWLAHVVRTIGDQPECGNDESRHHSRPQVEGKDAGVRMRESEGEGAGRHIVVSAE